MKEGEQEYFAVEYSGLFSNGISKRYFHELHPGDKMMFGVGNMGGETPKPGERCLLNKMFVCRRVITEADAVIGVICDFAFHGRRASQMRMRLLRAAVWIALGPKRYKEPHSYEVEFVGEEKTP